MIDPYSAYLFGLSIGASIVLVAFFGGRFWRKK